VPGVIGSGGSYGFVEDTSTDFTTLVGHHFTITSGTRTGMIGIVLGLVPGNAHRAYYLPLGSFGVTGSNTAPVSGDTYEVYSLVTISGQVSALSDTNVLVQDLVIDNSSNAPANVIEACGNSTFITEGCIIRGAQCTQRGGYWQSQQCYFDFTSSPHTLVAGVGGFFDNYGNAFNNVVIELSCGGGSDCVGDTVFTGTTCAGFSLVFDTELRWCYGANQSGWICFLETQNGGNPIFSVMGSCTVAQQSNSVLDCVLLWGHVADSPSYLYQIAEGGKWFYWAAPYGPPAVTGYTTNPVAIGNGTTGMPINMPPHGCLWDITINTQQTTGVIPVTTASASLSLFQLLSTSIEASGQSSGSPTITAASAPPPGQQWTCHNYNTVATSFFGIAVPAGKSVIIRYSAHTSAYESVTSAN